MKLHLAPLLLIGTVLQLAEAKKEPSSSIRRRAQSCEEGSQRCLDASSTQYKECVHGSEITRWLAPGTVCCPYQENRIIMAFSSNDCPPPFDDVGSCNDDDSQCGKCQGDCDNDDECASGLFCWFRSSSSHSFEENVPHGCSGAPVDGSTDYCISPDGYAGALGEDACDEDGYLCGACEGDCDSDSECAEGLLCLYRDGGDPAPLGCSNNMFSSYDYCVDPTPYEGALGEDACDEDGYLCGACEGDCGNDKDCAEGLLCFQRDRGDPAPLGCSNNNMFSFYDYCVDPTPYEGALGYEACESDSKCSACQGDCDSDSGCEGDLICYKRYAVDDPMPPGCTNQAFGDSDYCGPAAP